MVYRDTHESLKALYAVAVIQGGYFTAKQAAKTGYKYPHLQYHLQAGNFERVGRGLYRLPTVPLSESDDLIRLALWSRDRRDHPQAVISHASALFLHQLGDVLPQVIHFTVPPSFRRRPPTGCMMHKEHLDKKDIEFREGYFLTTPLRTLAAVAEGTAVTDEQLNLAVREALQRGLVRASALSNTVARMPPGSRLGRMYEATR